MTTTRFAKAQRTCHLGRGGLAVHHALRLGLRDVPPTNSIGWFECYGVGVSGFEFYDFGADDLLARWRDQFVFSGGACSKDGFVKIAVSPLQVDFHATSCTEPVDGAGGPGLGQGGQESDFAEVALEEHLGDSGRSAEVGIDLEGIGTIFPDAVE